MIADEMKNLDDIEMKIIMKEGKIRLERITNSLDEFEMNALEIKKGWDRNMKKWRKEDKTNDRLFKKSKSLNYKIFV